MSSCQLSFQTVALSRAQIYDNQQPHKFELSIFSKYFKQSYKTFLHGVNNGQIDLGENLFILPIPQFKIAKKEKKKNKDDKNQINNNHQKYDKLESKLFINLHQVEDKNIEKLGNRQLQVAQHAIQMHQIAENLRNSRNGVYQGWLEFATSKNSINIKFKYLLKLVQNKIFAGCINNILQNQGLKYSSLLTMSQTNLMKVNGREQNFVQGKIIQHLDIPLTPIRALQTTNKKHNKLNQSQKDYFPHNSHHKHSNNKLKLPSQNNEKAEASNPTDSRIKSEGQKNQKVIQGLSKNKQGNSHQQKGGIGKIFKCCDQSTVDRDIDQIAQQSLPLSFNQNIKNELETHSINKMSQKAPIEHQTMAPNVDTSSKLNYNSSSLRLDKRQQEKEDKNASTLASVNEYKNQPRKMYELFKGPCKNKNMFSCMDVKVEEQEICIVQPVYK